MMIILKDGRSANTMYSKNLTIVGKEGYAGAVIRKVLLSII